LYYRPDAIFETGNTDIYHNGKNSNNLLSASVAGATNGDLRRNSMLQSGGMNIGSN
jgi:hypothetical protein